MSIFTDTKTRKVGTAVICGEFCIWADNYLADPPTKTIIALSPRETKCLYDDIAECLSTNEK